LSYEVLARKYRPLTFAEVVGQEGAVRTLQNAVRENRVAPAYIFSGTRGVGKTTVARLLAKALNCEKGPTPEPCGECVPCTEIAESRCLDVYEIDAASNTGVDSVRELRDSIPYAPARDRFKVFIIDEAHMLSNAAWNALLKTLEEPPPHVRFIFATTEPNKILDTIKSRSQHFDFRTLPRERIRAHLERIIREEGLSPAPGVLELVVRAASGSVRDALSTLDQVTAFAGEEATEEDARAVLGLVAEETLDRFLGAVAARDPGAALEVVGELAASGQEFRRFNEELLEELRLIVLFHALRDVSSALELDESEAERLERLAGQINLDEAVRLFGLLERVDRDLRQSSRERQVFEVAAVRLTRLVGLEPLEELVGRLAGEEGSPGRGGSASGPAPSGRPQAGKKAPARSGRAGRSRTAPPETAPGPGRETINRAPPAGGGTPPGEGPAGPEPPIEAYGEVDGDRMAESFRAALSRRKAPLGAYLSHASAVREEGASLVVAFPAAERLWARRLETPEAREALREAAREVTGREMEVLVRLEDGPGGASRGERPAERRQRLMDEALKDPLVQQTMDRFRARVVEARETDDPEAP
jgi:DNA polymerase-3 subunit gamma/tau